MKHLKSFIKAIFPEKYIPKLRGFRDLLRGLLYLGNRFICPVCGGHFRKFHDFGPVGLVKQNEQCPRCLSLRRHRLLWLYLKEKTNFFDTNLKVLHIAPEYCFYQRFENQKNRLYRLNYAILTIKIPVKQDTPLKVFKISESISISLYLF